MVDVEFSVVIISDGLSVAPTYISAETTIIQAHNLPGGVVRELLDFLSS